MTRSTPEVVPNALSGLILAVFSLGILPKSGCDILDFSSLDHDLKLRGYVAVLKLCLEDRNGQSETFNYHSGFVISLRVFLFFDKLL